MTVNEEKKVIIIGDNYKYSFSRGLLAHSLESRGLTLEGAYVIAFHVYNKLIEEEIFEIKENDLRKYVKSEAVRIVGEEIALQYNLIEKWRLMKFPLIIMISGTGGTQTASIARLLAEKLGIHRIASTSTVTEILRKMMSKELSPELHEKGYQAWKKLRPTYSILYDKVLIGFEEHAKYPAEAIEALVKRAILEGISLVLYGEHLVPRFLSTNFFSKSNVIHLTISIENEKIHETNYLAKYKKSRQEKKLEHFKSVRKIQEYLIQEAKQRGFTIIENSTINNAVDECYKIALDRLSKIIEDKSFEEYAQTESSLINS